MNLWRFVAAHEIRVMENCKAEIEAFLRRLTPNVSSGTRRGSFCSIRKNHPLWRHLLSV